ncbi:MAG: hypothetical protein IJ711_12240 [Lachnospiraceae bacterium]|nr:hypothetical protein [Lachnospiraceae bacterium]
MYIEGRFWNNYIGDTDDSLTLVEYLADKHKTELSMEEIFSDLGFDKRNGNFRYSESPITVELKNINSEYDENFVEFYYAIDLVVDLAAILLECKHNGNVDLRELFGDDLETPEPIICITSTQKEDEIINNTLMEFISAPLEFDLSEMCPEEDMFEMAEVCENLRKELYVN